MPKNFLIAHKGNNYQPHLLQPKRAYFYGSFLVGLKVMVTAAILMLPATAFLTEDIFAAKEKEIIEYTNKLRLKDNLPAVKVNVKLENSARTRSEDMLEKGYFNHVSPDGLTFDSFLRQVQFDYKKAGENLAIANYDMKQVVAAWEKSPAHFNNLVDKDFENIGVGIAAGEYKGEVVTFVTQHMGVERKAGQEEEARDFVNSANSKVSWREDGQQTILSAKIEIPQKVEDVRLLAYGREVPLVKNSNNNEYVGEMIIAQPAAELFKVMVLPAVLVKFDGNKTAVNNVQWNEPYIPVVGALEKYIYRRGLLKEGQYNVYTIGRKVFTSFFLVFGIVFFLYLAVTRDKKHAHIVRHAVWFLILCGSLIFL